MKTSHVKLFAVTSDTTAELAAPPSPAAPKIPSTAGMTTKVVKGSLWTLAGQVLPLGVSLFTTPFVIRMLGAEGYGVFVLVALIPTYFIFADLGMGLASTKFASEAYAAGDTQKEARIVRTAALIALSASLPFAIAIFILSGWLVTLFNVPEHLLGEATLALRIASVTFVVNFLNNIFNTPQLARLRMDLNTFVTSGFRMLGLIAIPVVLYLGFGIVGAVTVLLIASVLTLAGHLFVSGRLSRHLFERTLDRPSADMMLRFGGALALSGVAAVLLVNLEKLVLPAVTSPKELAYYSVAFTFAGGAAMYSLAMGQALMPAFSQLLTPQKRTELERMFVRALRMNVFGILPILALLCVIGRPFFTAWAGEDFGRESTIPFYILLVGLFFNLNAYIPAGLIQAAGRTDVIAKLYWIELVPYIAATALLTYRFGAAGAAASWSLRVVADAAVYFILTKRIIGVRTGFSQYRDGLLAGSLILGLPVALVLFSGINFIWPLAALILCVGVYAVVVWRTVLDGDEKAWLSKQLSRIAGPMFKFKAA